MIARLENRLSNTGKRRWIVDGGIGPVKVNNMTMIAHVITLGKDFLLFSVPALYHRHQEHVDRYTGMVQWNFSRHCKIVDKNVINRLPRSFIHDKDH
ncbi:reticulon-like protein B16 [Lolium rigidum]|uniref:reticulon-like protein B16 n=1 Tax=Lolium rigidum TaxID=89674 RepID=UPI001F5D34D5|nr:reticulon-like protein B16 [Lolium rigidum]